MEVKENLISFKVLWKGKNARVKDTQKTRDAISEWQSNEMLELELVKCGAPKDGPIDLVFENLYSESNEDKALLNMNLRKLIETFRENEEIQTVWLQWNDITEDVIWTDKEAAKDLNRQLHKKDDYIVIHQK